MNWENQSNLPDPDPQDGWVFRWIRTSLLGGIVIIQMYLEDFVKDGNPVVWKIILSLQIHMMDHQSDWAKKGNIEIGGLLLCKMPKEDADARSQHFDQIAKDQIEAVDNTFFKDQDSRMATKQVFERKTKTTFGKDS